MYKLLALIILFSLLLLNPATASAADPPDVEKYMAGADPVTGRNEQIDLSWEQLCLSTSYELQIAKERVSTMTSPEKKVTIHESWFPLQRPLTTTSFLLILAFALFFFCVFLGTLARQFGFFVDYGFQIPIRKLGSGSPWTWFFSQFTMTNIGLAAGLIVCIGVIIYYFTK